MMNNRWFLGVLIILFLMAADSAFADNNHDPSELLEVVDGQLLKRIGPDQDFSENRGYVNEIAENKVIHQYYVADGAGTDALLSLSPVSEKVISSSKYLNFTETGFRNFHLSLTVQQKESIPKSTGGACWIRCSDVMLKGQGREKGFLIIPGSKILRVDNGAENEIFDLSGLDPSESIQFDIIRLDGVVFIYADKEFLFSFPDEIPGPLFVDAGSMLFPSGNRVRCDFDDFRLYY